MRSVWVGWWASLSCSVVLAQAPAADLDRARRDAEKVFRFIQFHAVKRAAPARPPTAPSRDEPRAAVRAPGGERSPPPAAGPATPRSAASAPSPGADDERPPPSAATEGPAAASPAVDATGPAPAEPANPDGRAEATDGGEEEGAVALRLLDLVAPSLSPSLLASLGPSTPRVRLRFRVEADGRVSSAAALDGTPRRLAAVAERALLQWRFEALPAAQEAEVELVLQRD